MKKSIVLFIAILLPILALGQVGVISKNTADTATAAPFGRYKIIGIGSRLKVVNDSATVIATIPNAADLALKADVESANFTNNVGIGGDLTVTGKINQMTVSRGVASEQTNVAVGYNALAVQAVGIYHTAIGANALGQSTGGIGNTGIGQSAIGGLNTSGSWNSAVGVGTLNSNTTGSWNVASGVSALNSNQTGNYNSSFGAYSSFDSFTGTGNTALGARALESNSSGSYNIAIGYKAGSEKTAGFQYTSVENSIFIGSNSKAKTDDDTNEIVIGHEAVGNGSNTVTLGNDNITTTYLKGNIVNTSLTNAINQKSNLESPTFTTDIGVSDGADSVTVSHRNITFSKGSNSIIPRTTNTLNLNIGDVSNNWNQVDITGSTVRFLGQPSFPLVKTSSFGALTQATSADVITTLGYTPQNTINNTANYLQKQVSSGVFGNSLIYDNGTSIGIGTASPISKLQVVDASPVSIRATRTSNSYVDLYAGSSAYGSGLLSTNKLLFSASNSVTNPDLVISTSGNIGIGTTTPTRKLEVYGGDDVGIRLFNSSANYWEIINSNLGKLDFIRGGVNHMRIDQSGNIGIGTTSPASKLTVTAGDIETTTAAKGIIMKTPDGTKRYKITIDNSGNLVSTLL